LVEEVERISIQAKFRTLEILTGRAVQAIQ
jgi:hypothetical protein